MKTYVDVVVRGTIILFDASSQLFPSEKLASIVCGVDDIIRLEKRMKRFA